MFAVAARGQRETTQCQIHRPSYRAATFKVGRDERQHEEEWRQVLQLLETLTSLECHPLNKFVSYATQTHSYASVVRMASVKFSPH